MTVIELAKLLATHISQGRGNHTVALFQWQHGSEPATELQLRDACNALELYSGTVPPPDSCRYCDGSGQCVYPGQFDPGPCYCTDVEDLV